jgi:hypothetical protein
LCSVKRRQSSGEGGVDGAHRVEVALEGAGEVGLAGEVGAVGDPDGEGFGIKGLADLDAFEVVLDGLSPRGRVGVGEGAELVGEGLAGLVLKGVGVHRVEGKAEGFCLIFQCLGVGFVPRDVERDGGGGGGEAVDDGAVVELVEDVARLTGAGEASKARAAGADAPGWDGNAERQDLGFDRFYVDAAAVELLAERLVVAPERRRCGGRFRR